VQGEEDGVSGHMSSNIARAYWRFTVLWLIAGSVTGILAALSIISPQFLAAHPILGYGRLVQVHRTLMIHGVMFSVLFGCCYALLPRLARSKYEPGTLSRFLTWASFILVLLGTVLILLGHGSGREYSDLPPLIAFLFWLYLIATAFDIGRIVSGSGLIRQSPATGLLFLAAVIPSIAYVFALPGWWGAGGFDVVRTWIGWRTLFILSFTIGAIGIAVWHSGSIRPRRGLSTGGFVLGLALVLTLAPFMGIVHVLETPVTDSLRAIGAFTSILAGTGILLIISSLWTGSITSPPGLLVFAGLTGIAAACVQGIAMTLPPIHTAFHFTLNTPAHAHIALGGILLVFIAGTLILVPRITRASIKRTELVSTGSGLMVSGIAIIFLFMAVIGAIQAMGHIQNLSHIDWLPMFRWLHIGILAGGIAFLTGSVLTLHPVLKAMNSVPDRPDVPGPVESDSEDDAESDETVEAEEIRMEPAEEENEGGDE